MEKSKLEMEFLDEQNKKFTISIEAPRTDLSSEEVKTAMESIIGLNVFDSSMNDLVSANDARVVTTSTEKLSI